LIKTVRRLAGILALALAGFAFSPLSPALAAGTAYTHTNGPHAAAPASASQSDPSSCTTGSSSGNVDTCMSWSNSGTHINYIDGTATVINVARVIKICIHSSVTGTIKCNSSGYIYVSPGGHIAVDWSPNTTEPSATYCVRTWRQNDDGTDTLIGELCTIIA